VPPLDKLDLDADTFADVAESAQSDHDVLARERAVGARPLTFVQPGASQAPSEAPETALFVGKQQSRAALCSSFQAGV
jgi:hypothetical protein